MCRVQPQKLALVYNHAHAQAVVTRRSPERLGGVVCIYTRLETRVELGRWTSVA